MTGENIPTPNEIQPEAASNGRTRATDGEIVRSVTGSAYNELGSAIEGTQEWSASAMAGEKRVLPAVGIGLGALGVFLLKPWRWFKGAIAHPIKSLIMGGVATIAGLALWPTLKRHGRRTLDAFMQPEIIGGTKHYSNQAQSTTNATPEAAIGKLKQGGDFTAVLTGAIGNDQNLMNQLSALQTSVEIKPMPADYQGKEQEQALYHVEKNRDNGYERKIVYIKDGASPQAVKGALLQAVHGDMFETEGVFSPIPRTSTILGFGGKTARMSAEQLVMVSLVSQMAAYAEAQNPNAPGSVFEQLASGTYVPPDVLKTMRANAAVELARAKANGTIGEGNEKVANALITNIGHSAGLDMDTLLGTNGMRMQTAFWKEVQDPNYGQMLEPYILKNRPLYDPERRLARLQTSNAVAGQGAAPVEEPATTESLKIIRALGTTKGHYMQFPRPTPIPVGENSSASIGADALRDQTQKNNQSGISLSQRDIEN